MAAGLLLSSAAFAATDTPGEGFDRLYNYASDDGPCSVQRVRGVSSTYYIPTDRSNPNARFNVLVWGNGTGGTATTYRRLLESVASHCIAVAAANTSSSGSGREMSSALDSMRSRYGDILGDKVCTAGHSQGGGGSFNAANLIGADCVIPVQPDTRFTTRIRDDLASHVEVIALWSSRDTLAPASGNRRNVQNASSILTQVETSGEGHFAPTTGRGGNIGTLFRLANIAQLSNNPEHATEARRAFWGPATEYTVTDSHRDISDVRRDRGAEATAP
ncbi:hypothetical protein CAI21_20470 [Alkalilimnicola ehrlichii]|uniref:Alpha/beta hydrolase n=1 Tax=Alkalilimnicola ehrlichii TaxID=351052 RepID=A0A3E0WR51_9GAMM|nr:hypothetical protein [Alkalilimnicola ehrlichii]RFA24728.1 hypothetical protein CAI21_20470 [Alkalilimnicola ehrlichii]RFA35440.1 hypothetical protein CAL65_13270 [Alkalilimnicola ehrlichii]